MDAKLEQRISDFQSALKEAKALIPTMDQRWYPYGTLGNICLIDELMPEGWLSFQGSLKGKVADISAADGEVAFFLEREGISADIIDNPPTNYNGMDGAKALKRELGSNVRIYEMDLDGRFISQNSMSSLSSSESSITSKTQFTRLKIWRVQRSALPSRRGS